MIRPILTGNRCETGTIVSFLYTAWEFQELCVSGIIFYLVLVRRSVIIWLIMLSADETNITSRCSLGYVHYMVFMICIKTSVNFYKVPKQVTYRN